MSNDEGPPGGERGEGRISLHGLPADVRRGWREFKELVQRIGTLVESAASLALDMYGLLGRFLSFAFGRPVHAALLGAAVGLSAPLTGGLGVIGEHGSQPELWLSAVAVAVIAAGLSRAIRPSTEPGGPSTAATDQPTERRAPALTTPPSAMPAEGRSIPEQLITLETVDDIVGAVTIVRVHVSHRPAARFGQTVLQGLEDVR